MSEPETIEVPAGQWSGTFAELRDRGADYFDFLAATDLGEGRTAVTAHVLTADARHRFLVTTELAPDEPVDSLAGLFPAASWHEREAADLVGVVFVGHPDPRPLTLVGAPGARGSGAAAEPAEPTDQPPLRRTTALPARTNTPWPGLTEPGVEAGTTRRRRPRGVPGVHPEWADGQEPS